MPTLRPELRRNGAAVDSELACLPQLAMPAITLAGPHFNPLYGTTNAAMLHPTNGILLVTRLDGPTLGDRPQPSWRNRCRPRRTGFGGMLTSTCATSLIRVTKSVMIGFAQRRPARPSNLAFETFLDEKSDTFTASFPMSQIAIYMGWYRENVSGPFTLAPS
jgi:hypothetical protein